MIEEIKEIQSIWIEQTIHYYKYNNNLYPYKLLNESKSV